MEPHPSRVTQEELIEAAGNLLMQTGQWCCTCGVPSGSEMCVLGPRGQARGQARALCRRVM